MYVKNAGSAVSDGRARGRHVSSARSNGSPRQGAPPLKQMGIAALPQVRCRGPAMSAMLSRYLKDFSAPKVELSLMPPKYFPDLDTQG
jgi:hypothetical protein